MNYTAVLGNEQFASGPYIQFIRQTGDREQTNAICVPFVQNIRV